jgi:hypothetical protein
MHSQTNTSYRPSSSYSAHVHTAHPDTSYIPAPSSPSENVNLKASSSSPCLTKPSDMKRKIALRMKKNAPKRMDVLRTIREEQERVDNVEELRLLAYERMHAEKMEYRRKKLALIEKGISVFESWVAKQ